MRVHRYQIISLIITLLFGITDILPFYAYAESAYVECIIPLISDKSDMRICHALKKDGVLYVTLEDACELTGSTIYEQNDDYFITERCYVKFLGSFNEKSNLCITSLDIDNFKWDGIKLENSLLSNVVSYINPIKFDSFRYNSVTYVEFFEYLNIFGADVGEIKFETYKSIVENIDNSSFLSTTINDNDLKWQIKSNTGLDFFDFEAYYTIEIGTTLDQLYEKFINTEEYRFSWPNVGAEVGVFGAKGYDAIINDYDGISNYLFEDFDPEKKYQDILVKILDSNFGDYLKKTDRLENVSLKNTFTNASLLGLSKIPESLATKKIVNIIEVASKANSFVVQPVVAITTVNYYYAVLSQMIDNMTDLQINMLREGIIENKDHEQYSKKNAGDVLNDIANFPIVKFMWRYNAESLESIASKIQNTVESYSALYDSAYRLNEYIEDQEEISKDRDDELEKKCGIMYAETMLMETLEFIPQAKLIVESLEIFDTTMNIVKEIPLSKSISYISDAAQAEFVLDTVLNNVSIYTDPEQAYYPFIMALQSSLVAYSSVNEATTRISNYENQNINRICSEISELIAQTINCNINFYNLPQSTFGEITSSLNGETLSDYSISKEKYETIIVHLNPDYNAIYYKYIEDELLPHYGLAELTVTRSGNTTHTNLLGIVSAAIYDFCDDGVDELLVLTREKKDDVMSTYYLNMYQYTGNKVVLLDRIETEEYSISSGGQHVDSFELFIAGNAIYQQLETARYGSAPPYVNTTEYTIIDVNHYRFNKYQYAINLVNAVDKSSGNILYHDKNICAEWNFSDDCTECSLNTSITNAEAEIRQKLDKIAFSYTSCTLSSENGLNLNLNVNESMKICDYSSYQKFNTIDYTNLRGHISARVIDYEEIYYSYIENELIPQYGLSDLAGFEAVNWNVSPVVNEIPSCTQGIIGAKIYDYNEDGYKECLIIRQEKTDYIVECYDQNLELLDTHIACSFRPGNPGYNVLLNVSMLENYILIESSSSSFPNLSRSGTNITLLRLFDGKLNETVTFGGNRATMQYEELYLNDETIQDTMLTEEDVESMENKIGSALQSLGISFDNLEVGWINLSYGVEIEFTDEPILLFENVNSDGVTYFNDFTNLREYITAPATPTITDISGRYSNDKLFVDVIGEIGSEGNIRVEYVDEGRSYINYQGMLSENLEFFAEDGYCKNSYKIKFYDDKIDIKIYAVEYINVIDPWSIPEVYETLERTSKKIPDYNISSWTDEMIVKAINNYLKGSSDWKQYAVFTSDIYGTRVMMRYQGGMEANTLTKYFVAWGYSEDFAHIALQNTGGTPDAEFHLTEYLNAEVSSTNKVGKVVTENDALNVRQLPSTESEKIGTVDKGSTITILSEVNGWYEIEFNGNSGYVSGEYVEIID